MRRAALRQPPPLPEAAWTGWSRLEPVATAREPKSPHKGRRRFTARVSLRGAAVEGELGPCPSPSLCSLPGPCRQADSPEGTGDRPGFGGADLWGRAHPAPALPSPRSRISCVETCVREVSGVMVVSRPSGLAWEVGWALCGLGTEVSPRILEAQPRVLTSRCSTQLPLCGEISGGPCKIKPLKWCRKESFRFGESSLFPLPALRHLKCLKNGAKPENIQNL